MGKIFYVCMAREGGGEAFLNLPATPWELLDVQDKLRLKDGEVPYISIEEYYRFDFLGPALTEDCSLEELNALAQKLSELDERQSIVFEGMLQMEGGSVAIPQAIDLAYSTEYCHVVGEARNDAQLGRFYAKNGSVPQVEDLPDELFDLLDFERLGREMRQGEGGVFVEDGYVLQHRKPVEAYRTLDLTLKAPDYTILLETAKGFFDDPSYDSDRTVRLKLPAAPEDLDSTLDKLGAWDWREVGWRCLDCKAPSLTDIITGCEEDIHTVNSFARTLADMEPEQLTTYKALLEAADCKNLDQAIQLADRLDDYIFTPQCSSPVDVAMGELSVILAQRDAEQITPYLNLHQYGQALIQRDGGALTGYGFISRKDGQDILYIPTERTVTRAGPAVQPDRASAQPDILNAFPYLERLAADADAETAAYARRSISDALDGRGAEGPRQLQAAMEYEDCANLSEAAEIAGRLDSYEFIPVDHFRADAKQELLAMGLDRRVVECCFDFESYAAILNDFEDLYTSRGTGLYVHRDMGLEQQGLTGMEMM